MNVLLVNYGRADNNSAHHILGLARGLAARGHDVMVAMAKVVPDGEWMECDGVRGASHRALLQGGARFADGGGADVMHAWTPRENARLFAEAWAATHGAQALAIHLEDNEEAIFRCFTGKSADEAAGLDHEWPRGLIHPRRHRRFLAEAQGLSVVHRCLFPLATASARVAEIVPPMGLNFFSPGPDRLRGELGLADSTLVVAYTGDDHAASAGDIRMLYDAIDLLIDRGRDVALVRTGHVLPTHHDGLSVRPGPRCVELGFLERDRVPEVMRMADICHACIRFLKRESGAVSTGPEEMRSGYGWCSRINRARTTCLTGGRTKKFKGGDYQNSQKRFWHFWRVQTCVKSAVGVIWMIRSRPQQNASHDHLHDA